MCVVAQFFLSVSTRTLMQCEYKLLVERGGSGDVSEPARLMVGENAVTPM